MQISDHQLTIMIFDNQLIITFHFNFLSKTLGFLYWYQTLICIICKKLLMFLNLNLLLSSCYLATQSLHRENKSMFILFIFHTTMESN